MQEKDLLKLVEKLISNASKIDNKDAFKKATGELRFYLKNYKLTISQKHLFNIIRSGNVAFLKILLKYHPFDLTKAAEETLTPLMVAAISGKLEMFDCLVKDYQLDPLYELPETGGYTALFSAIYSGNTQTVDHLVKYYPYKWDAQGGNKISPFSFAVYRGDIPMVDHIVKNHAANPLKKDPFVMSPLLTAALGGDIKMFDHLVSQYNMDPQQEKYKGCGPLMMAAERGHLDFLKHVVKTYSLDIRSEKNHIGWDALVVAAAYGRIEMLDYLAKHFDLSCHKKRGKFGWTPLLAAASKGQLKMIDHLVRYHGVEIKKNFWTKSYQIIEVAKQYQQEDVQLLIEAYKNMLYFLEFGFPDLLKPWLNALDKKQWHYLLQWPKIQKQITHWWEPTVMAQMIDAGAESDNLYQQSKHNEVLWHILARKNFSKVDPGQWGNPKALDWLLKTPKSDPNYGKDRFLIAVGLMQGYFCEKGDDHYTLNTIQINPAQDCKPTCEGIKLATLNLQEVSDQHPGKTKLLAVVKEARETKTHNSSVLKKRLG